MDYRLHIFMGIVQKRELVDFRIQWRSIEAMKASAALSEKQLGE